MVSGDAGACSQLPDRLAEKADLLRNVRFRHSPIPPSLWI
jgi:hypothetical protein